MGTKYTTFVKHTKAEAKRRAAERKRKATATMKRRKEVKSKQAARLKAAEAKFKAALKKASRLKTALEQEQREERVAKKRIRIKTSYGSAMTSKYPELVKHTKAE